jgi:hypothetical protein
MQYVPNLLSFELKYYIPKPFFQLKKNSFPFILKILSIPQHLGQRFARKRGKD